ncbi:hypothetical protein DFH09DRAFT_1322372 [Mycena vulgaris]|nr:hypothetical protein DFH09DRAFT_1322372 [Mycena vulgaris]
MDSVDLDYTTFSWDHRLYRGFFLAGLVILIYDHLLTFGSEVKHIWSSKLWPSTCWFLTVRYTALAANITISVFYFADLSHEVRVQLLYPIHKPLTALFYRGITRNSHVFLPLTPIFDILVEYGGTLGLRVFAMYGLNLWILVCLLGAGVLGAALALWSIVKYRHPQMLSAPELSGCHTSIPRISITCQCLAGAWEAQLVCDVLVFELTGRRAYIQRRGAMYLGIIVITNLANLFTFYFGDVLLSGFLTTSLSVTLLSRLMLNLYEAANVGIGTAEPNMTELETLRFGTLYATIRMMGSSLLLALLLCYMHSTHAADPDVFPDEVVVRQCATLDVIWSQPPPIHLQVQYDTLINVKNLVDLGPQLANSFTTFQVALPIGHNFSFVYSTIADPFTVFISRLMQVAPGTTDCLPGQVSSVPSAPSAPTVVCTTSAVSPTPQSQSTQSPSSSNSAFPVGLVVGSVYALAGVLLMGIAVLWLSRRHRRSETRYLQSVPNQIPTTRPSMSAADLQQSPSLLVDPGYPRRPMRRPAPPSPVREASPPRAYPVVAYSAAAYPGGPFPESFSTHTRSPTIIGRYTSSPGGAAGDNGSISGKGPPPRPHSFRVDNSEEMPPADD